MAVKHNKVATLPDEPGAEVNKLEWNEDHVIDNGTITNDHLAGSIDNTKLLTNPLARANHTGTQLKSTISDFAHTHPLTDVSDVSITATNLNTLDDGVNTTLHFHDSDRARANHTGTQTASTISDYASATAVFTNKTIDVEDATNVLKQTTPAVGEYLRDNGTKFVSSTIQAGDLPTAIDATKIADGSVTNAEFQRLDATSSIQTQLDGKAASGHTHVLTAGATDVTMTSTNLNTLDDGVNTTLHFHDSDRNRANHTGTQTRSTISDFAHKDTHKTGGGDAFTVSDLLDAIARVTVRKNTGADIGSRRRLNLIEGTNITLTIADDAAGEEVDVTIDATGAGGGSDWVDFTPATNKTVPAENSLIVGNRYQLDSAITLDLGSLANLTVAA